MSLWWLVAGLIGMTAVIKAAGPVLVGGRELPEPFMRVIALMAPPLLSALVVTAVFADGPRLAIGAHTVGVAVAGVLLWWRRSLVLSAGVAMVVTALIRAVAT